jgi:hypothetical protein
MPGIAGRLQPTLREHKLSDLRFVQCFATLTVMGSPLDEPELPGLGISRAVSHIKGNCLTPVALPMTDDIESFHLWLNHLNRLLHPSNRFLILSMQEHPISDLRLMYIIFRPHQQITPRTHRPSQTLIFLLLRLRRTYLPTITCIARCLPLPHQCFHVNTKGKSFVPQQE